MQMFVGKVATFKSHALVLSLVLGPLWTSCKAQYYEDEAKQSPEGDGGTAFFALRSCHQSLGGQNGDFFSPDYVCANPPLWCNWTIRAQPGQRIHLNLQDLTPDQECHLKQDQVEVNEAAAARRVLRGCWREASYTSRSDTLHVILLIAGRPAQQYRGFYAHYRAFGPLVSDGMADVREAGFGPMVLEREGHPTSTVFTSLEASDSKSVQPPNSQDPTWSETTLSDSPFGSSWTERGSPRIPWDLPEPLHHLTGKRRDVYQADTQNLPTEAGGNKMEPTKTPTSSEEQSPGWTLSHPNKMESLSDHHGKYHVWNASQDLHQPGDRLFEVSLEVQMSPDHNRSQNHLDESLMKSIKALVLQHLDGLRIPLNLSFKRIKRLRLGELYIMWLNAGRGGTEVYDNVHRGLRQLLGQTVASHATVASVSVGDVNECGTQLALCDINADCLDQFGSYRCRCKDGFRDASHLGPRGTVCVDPKAKDCDGGLTGETQGVYVLFFLLSALLLISMATACALYRRHRSGAFLIKGSPGGYVDDTYAGAGDQALPPPPPPSRSPLEQWPMHKERCSNVDLQLLRFGPLTPSDIYTDPQDGGKK
ncbi:uncharacterized protein LOC144198220 isoform X2 [Stigmatopora nigra]